jgi:hypothetical protein
VEAGVRDPQRLRAAAFEVLRRREDYRQLVTGLTSRHADAK